MTEHVRRERFGVMRRTLEECAQDSTAARDLAAELLAERRAHDETRAALAALVEDIQDRARWDDDAKVVCVGNGVYNRALGVLERIKR